MSIVEKALSKIQADRTGKDRPPGRAEPQIVIGKVVEHPATGVEQAIHSNSRPAPAVAPRPSRLVLIDRGALRSAGLFPPESEERELSHQYRAIKRPLIRNAFEPVGDPQGNPRQLIMLASALPGEGKTFTIINLALSLSLEKDRAVLLVDADVAKPHVSRVFGVEEEAGLLDVLGDTRQPIDSLLPSLILPTDVPGLSVLPAGRRSETASELLASERMREVIQYLAALYPRGIVLFDSSPVLLTTEARVLASLVGQVVVVVKADTTPQQAVKDALGLLEGVRGVSLVLNQANLSGPMGYYYGYAYGYAAQPSGAADASAAGPS